MEIADKILNSYSELEEEAQELLVELIKVIVKIHEYKKKEE